MEFPLVLAGPILRRVEPNLVSVWLALSESASVKLTLWEGRATADKPSLLSGPTPAAKTLRVGDKLHMVVVALKIPAGSGQTLLPGRIYSYDLSLTTQSGKTENLKSLNLLKDGVINGLPHLALGYEPDVLPSFSLPPAELTDLRIVHGSCRRANSPQPDGQVWVDDLINEARRDQSTYVLKRPHQLLLTGDQIYADDVSRQMLFMLSRATEELIGSKRDESEDIVPIEELPVGSRTWSANLINFPAGQRDALVQDEARMTSIDGHSHLFSLGEFCAMYLFSWSNSCWPATLPPPGPFLPPFHWEGLIPSELRTKITPPIKREETDKVRARERDHDLEIKMLTKFRAGLPKVRRGLANVPTYMMFDDHEVTDDWYLNPLWRDRVLNSPLGKTIIRNGLLSYALFQALVSTQVGKRL